MENKDSKRKVRCAKRAGTLDSYRCGMSKETFSGFKVTLLWVTYLLLGSIAFKYIEERYEVVPTTSDHQHWARFKELAGGREVVDELLTLRTSLLQLCPHPVLNHTFGRLENGSSNDAVHNSTSDSPLFTVLKKIQIDEDWWQQVEDECEMSLKIVEHVSQPVVSLSLVDSIYFTMTAVTTIGYGHIYPKTKNGQLFCVLYCLVGVPLTCILLAKSSDMLSNRLVKFYEKVKKRHGSDHKRVLLWTTCFYLTVGFIVFMFLPSVALSKLEGWTYEEALYYTFITLSTIGFGEYYAGYGESTEAYQDLYKLCIVVWIMVALGYWFLLLNFLQKVLRKNVPQRIKKSIRKSKRVTKQSEFFKQLVSKVVSQRTSGEQKTQEESDNGVMALVVEVADAIDNSRRPSRQRNRLPSIKPEPDQDTQTLESEDESPLTLSQLLDVNVIVRSEGVPSLINIVAQSPKEHEYSRTLSSLALHNGDSDSPPPQEVTLSLREVLNLVTLIKSVEDGVEAANSHNPTWLQDDSSPPSTITSMDREFVPLLRGGFCETTNKHIMLNPQISKFGRKEENEMESIDDSEDYSEDESGSGNYGDSQEDEESVEAEARDVEKGAFRKFSYHIHKR